MKRETPNWLMILCGLYSRTPAGLARRDAQAKQLAEVLNPQFSAAVLSVAEPKPAAYSRTTESTSHSTQSARTANS